MGSVTWDEFHRERPKRFTENHAPWEMLAASIIKAAVEDWFRGSKKRKLEVERFLRSDYFSDITDLNPDWLLKMMRGGCDVEKFKYMMNRREVRVHDSMPGEELS